MSYIYIVDIMIRVWDWPQNNDGVGKSGEDVKKIGHELVTVEAEQ